MKMKIKLKSGKVDKESLEKEIKKKIPRYSEYEFDYQSNHVFVSARNDDMAKDEVELFIFTLWK